MQQHQIPNDLRVARIPHEEKKRALWLVFGPLTGLLVVNILQTINFIFQMLGPKGSQEPVVNIFTIINGFYGACFFIASLICIPIGIHLLNKKMPSDSLEFDKRSGTGKYSIIPDELKKWNWGAFGLNVVWGVYFRVWISFLTFIPLLGIIWMILLGFKGNEWAWRKNAWLSIEEFQTAQEKWKTWGIIFFILNIIGTIASIYINIAILS